VAHEEPGDGPVGEPAHRRGPSEVLELVGFSVPARGARLRTKPNPGALAAPIDHLESLYAASCSIRSTCPALRRKRRPISA
jgi:hypothetical protein